jgi:AcrR family transcriptional regulator
MSSRTVDWARAGVDPPPTPEGLRERKKRLMRQQLSDTATEMFVERGFEAVRIAEIAEACGVSEKTVYNYFPTKESLVLDRWDTTLASLTTGLADVGVTPVQAARQILAGELRGLTSWLASQADPAAAAGQVQRFGALVGATPALRAHQRDVTDQLITAAAATLAARVGKRPDDPEPRIAATALLGLWDIHFASLRKHLPTMRSPAQLQRAVTRDVERAARVLDDGLGSFGSAVGKRAGR